MPILQYSNEIRSAVRKKILFVIAALVVVFGIGWWYLFFGSRIIDGSSEITAGEDGTRSLVVYFRYYRSAFWGTAATAWIEEALNLRPGLAAQPENLDDYDVVYVGYPIWLAYHNLIQCTQA